LQIAAPVMLGLGLGVKAKIFGLAIEARCFGLVPSGLVNATGLMWILYTVDSFHCLLCNLQIFSYCASCLSCIFSNFSIQYDVRYCSTNYFRHSL